MRDVKISKNNVTNSSFVVGDGNNVGGGTSTLDVSTTLQSLIDELQGMVKLGRIDPIGAVDVEGELKKAHLLSTQRKPEKSTIISHLERAKLLIAGISAAGGLVNGIVQVIELVRKSL